MHGMYMKGVGNQKFEVNWNSQGTASEKSDEGNVEIIQQEWKDERGSFLALVIHHPST
jgi:hypothetical protein